MTRNKAPVFSSWSLRYLELTKSLTCSLCLPLTNALHNQGDLAWFSLTIVYAALNFNFGSVSCSWESLYGYISLHLQISHTCHIWAVLTGLSVRAAVTNRWRLFTFSVFTHQVEVFSILFVLEQDKKHIVHCLNCARKVSPALDKFVVLNQYKLDELVEVYDSFQLGSIVSSDLFLYCTVYFILSTNDWIQPVADAVAVDRFSEVLCWDILILCVY